MACRPIRPFLFSLIMTRSTRSTKGRKIIPSRPKFFPPPFLKKVQVDEYRKIELEQNRNLFVQYDVWHAHCKLRKAIDESRYLYSG